MLIIISVRKFVKYQVQKNNEFALTNLIIPQDKGRPLPKFGEWDVNDPASAEGYTVIFNKARDEKKTGGKPESPAKADHQTKPPLEHGKTQSVRPLSLNICLLHNCDIIYISLHVHMFHCVCLCICIFLG